MLALQLFSRLAALAILPAQLPGNVVAMLDGLLRSPLRSISAWPFSLVRSLLLQFIRLQKLELPDDSILPRLANMRQRYALRGWLPCTVLTDDHLTLDAILLEPPPDVPARYVLFVGGNFQRYEDWLPYFDRYARDAEVGFFAFNFRGVACSEGAVCSAADLVSDLRACTDFLLARGVPADHLLIHGFSIGGAVAALFLATPGAPPAAFVSDRSFRSLCHAAYGMIRQPPLIAKGGDFVEDCDEGHGVPTQLLRLKELFDSFLRTVLGAAAVGVLRLLAWEMPADAAWPHIRGKKVILYHCSDSVIHYHGASLHLSLVRSGELGSDAQARTIEVTRMGSNGYPSHDFPLCADVVAWDKLIATVHWALDMHPIDLCEASGESASSTSILS